MKYGISHYFIIFAALASLISCDQHKETESKYELKIVDSKTYLLEQKSGNVYILHSGEFVRVPRIELNTTEGTSELKTYDDAIPGFKIHSRLKHNGGKLYYQITVSPEYTVEYQAYFDELLKRAFSNYKNSSENTNQRPLIEPKQKYHDQNWEKYWSVNGNNLAMTLYDKDSFGIEKISLALGSNVYSTPRTRIVDDKDVTTSIKYEGFLDMTATDFQRIQSLSTTYILEKPS